MFARADFPDMMLHDIVECPAERCADCSQKMNCDIMCTFGYESFCHKFEHIMLYADGE